MKVPYTTFTVTYHAFCCLSFAGSTLGDAIEDSKALGDGRATRVMALGFCVEQSWTGLLCGQRSHPR